MCKCESSSSLGKMQYLSGDFTIDNSAINIQMESFVVEKVCMVTWLLGYCPYIFGSGYSAELSTSTDSGLHTAERIQGTWITMLRTVTFRNIFLFGSEWEMG